jgi:UDP-glucuronate 4-epimerase
MRRDFTYIDDVSRIEQRLVDHSYRRRRDRAGADHPEGLPHVVAILERQLGRTVVKGMLPMQPGDITETFADVGALMRDTGLRPETSIEDGIRGFVVWYRDHYKL